MADQKQKAVILLSGGLDSATTLTIASDRGWKCYALSFIYGQRHQIEIEAAKRIAEKMGVMEHKIAQIDLRLFGSSALTDDIEVPKDRPHIGNGIPVTYVPARNTIFLSYALAYAEVIGAFDIFIGVNALDYSGYPDCRSEYISAFQKMANLATAAAVQGKGYYQIHTPIINMNKAQIISIGTRLGMDYALTHSCYDPNHSGKPCGRCDSCILRIKGFTEAGLTDPLEYPDLK